MRVEIQECLNIQSYIFPHLFSGLFSNLVMLVLWIWSLYIKHALFSLNNYIGSNHIYKLFISGLVNKSLVPMVVKPFLFISMIFYLYGTKWQQPLPQGAVFKPFLWLCIFCVPVKYIFRFSFAGRELGTWLWYWWGAQNASDDVRKRLWGTAVPSMLCS